MKYQRKPIKDFQGYEVDIDGSVWTYWELYKIPGLRGNRSRIGNTAKKMKTTILTDKRHKEGRIRVCLKDLNQKEHHVFVSRIVAEAFIPNPENKPFVCHKNSNPHDNRAENLRWDTQAGNMIDRTDRRLYGLNHGEINGASKLKSNEVVKIKQIILTTSLSNKEIGDIYGVTSSAISDIRLNKTWKHINYVNSINLIK